MAADKDHHSNEVQKFCVELGIRSYIPERQGGDRTWSDKNESTKAAFYQNRQRMRSSKGKTMQKRRSELVERGFAHVCETGGARRAWLRGIEKVRKRHLISVAAYNLGLVMRALFGFGKPRAFSASPGLTFFCCLATTILAEAGNRFRTDIQNLYGSLDELSTGRHIMKAVKAGLAFSTDCQVPQMLTFGTV